MPELPEVETVRRGIAPVIEGQVIQCAAVNRPDLRWPFPEKMADRVLNQRVLQVRRRSKYILVDLSGGETLLIHLGMSGRILISGDIVGAYVQDHQAVAKHDHVVLDFSNGMRLTFNDPRRFGAMDLFATHDEANYRLLKQLGPEPLGNIIDGGQFVSQLKARQSPIKSTLLDQSVIAGLGNIYVCETLYRAGISPARRSNKISHQRLNRILPHVQDVLRDAIEAGGSSLKDFRNAEGELGYFQHKFYVYGREGKPCKSPNCTRHIKRIVQSGRSSFYCPSCQK